MKLVRFHVDMSNETISSNGIHVAGNFQGWDPATTILYSFGNNVYEMICYMPVGIYEYKFFNGNNPGVSENVPSGCAVNGNREIDVTDDVLVPLVCYGACDPCLTGINETEVVSMNIYPNPASEEFYISSGDRKLQTDIILTDINGKILRSLSYEGGKLKVERESLPNGIYFVKLLDKLNRQQMAKVVFN